MDLAIRSYADHRTLTPSPDQPGGARQSNARIRSLTNLPHAL